MIRHTVTVARLPRQKTQAAVLSLIALALLGTATSAQRRGWEQRDTWQNPAGILEALQVREGSWIADVGAGDGYLTHHLAAAVGPQGRVFAEDINAGSLRSLRRSLPDELADRVTIVEGRTDSPTLPPDALDGVVALNAYHEFTEYQSMLASIRESLKPGGILVIADRATAADSTRSRRRQTSDHRLHYSLVREELVAAGFQIISIDPDFARQSGRSSSEAYWLIAARRPIQPKPIS
ncbi:methyltransferase domain-containing protein [Gemmatimonadota bacterium]